VTIIGTEAAMFDVHEGTCQICVMVEWLGMPSIGKSRHAFHQQLRGGIASDMRLHLRFQGDPKDAAIVCPEENVPSVVVAIVNKAWQAVVFGKCRSQEVE
jgi:hypothetical protein